MKNNDATAEAFLHCTRCRQVRRHMRFPRWPGWFCDYCLQYSPDTRPAGVIIAVCCLATVAILSIMAYIF